MISIWLLGCHPAQSHPLQGRAGALLLLLTANAAQKAVVVPLCGLLALLARSARGAKALAHERLVPAVKAVLERHQVRKLAGLQNLGGGTVSWGAGCGCVHQAMYGLPFSAKPQSTLTIDKLQLKHVTLPPRAPTGLSGRVWARGEAAEAGGQAACGSAAATGCTRCLTTAAGHGYSRSAPPAAAAPAAKGAFEGLGLNESRGGGV